MTVRIITEASYKRYHGRVEHPGWNPSAHFATLDFGDGAHEPAFVKLITREAYWPQLGNEVIGHTLAQHGELACPEKAAILVATAEFMRTTLGEHYPEDAPRTGDVSAWCTSLHPHLKDAAWTNGDAELALLALLRTHSGVQIAAFDTWLCNADRNPGNLLRMPRGRWAVIDHEMLFMTATDRGDWRAGPIDHLPADSSLWRKAHALQRAGRLTSKALRQIESGMVEYGDAHERIAADSAPRLRPLLETLSTPPAAQNVLDFLHARAHPTWMRKAVNVTL